jgi:inner membrane protein
MDTITQVLLGATLGAAAFQHRLGRSAIVIGGLGGLLPDLDLVSSAGGPWTSLVHHRGMTHSLLFAPVVAWPLALLSHRWTHKRVSTPFKGDLRPNGARADAPAHPLPRAAQAGVNVHAQLWFWALVTHPLLDLFTTYGTQLLWPLTDRRFSVDGVSIIDPVYSLPLLAAVVVAWRAGERARRAVRAARMALAFTTAYLLAGWVVGSSIEQRALVHWEAEDLEEVRAFPSLGNLA